MKKEAVATFYSKYRLYVFPLIVTLSSLFLIAFAIYPQTVKLISNQKAISNLINKSNFFETKVTALESYDETDLSRKVGLALSTYPVDKDFGNAVGLLQQLTVQSGFNVKAISLGGSGKLGKSESFEIKLEIQGPKALLSTLLNNLENSSRLIRVMSIDISSNQNSGAVDASLAVEILYSPIPQNLETVDSVLPSFSQKDEDLITTLARVNATAQSFSATESSAVSPKGKSNPFN